jgi:hypothetical protein
VFTQRCDMMTNVNLSKQTRLLSELEPKVFTYLVMINIGISCDHNAFLNSCFRYPTLYSLKVMEKKTNKQQSQKHVYTEKRKMETTLTF